MIHKTIKLDRAKLVALIKTTANKKKYKLGAKISPLSTLPEAWNKVDCSGYARWLIYHTAGIVMPDGSWNQRRWCEEQGFKPCVDGTGKLIYGPGNVGRTDNILRIAFMDPTKSGHGHVWLIINGLTIESYGGHGPGRRGWGVKALKGPVDYCFVLTDPLE